MTAMVARQSEASGAYVAGVTVQVRVKRLVVEALDLDLAPEALADDEELFGDLGADSVAVLEIVAALEEEFGFEVEDEDLTEELLASVASLTAYVERALRGDEGDVTRQREPAAGEHGVAAEAHAGMSRARAVLAVPDDGVLLKSCRHCGVILEGPQAPQCARLTEAAPRLGVDVWSCPTCAKRVSGARGR